CVSETDHLLAGRATTREVYGDLERGQGRRLTGAIAGRKRDRGAGNSFWKEIRNERRRALSTAMGSVLAGQERSTSGQQAFLQLVGGAKSFGDRKVLDSISLEIRRGEFLTILGESGSGKTTLLRILGGFEEATTGQILLDGVAVERQPAFRRPVNT